MTPVINPWVFYWMPVCDNLSFIVFGATCIFTIRFIALLIGYIGNSCSYGCEEEAETCKKLLKKLIPLVIITALLSCLIPSEETLTKMIVAQNVTVERVDMVSDTVVTVYNDIMNLFRDSGVPNG